MKLSNWVDALERIAPTSAAATWDNVGLLVGDASAEVLRAMLCIDYTPAVAREAEAARCELIVAYHPPIFEPIKRLPASSLIYDAVRRGVAIYSPHTALDVAEGGTNDVLADILGLSERRPLKYNETKAREVKLIVFLPKHQVDRVSDAMFAAGAGWIGKYSHCSFQIAGKGTFFGEAGARPTVGQAGRLEIAEEVRVETIVPVEQVHQVIGAMRAAHPYEEPAFDLQQLSAAPGGVGIGRIGTMLGTERSVLIDRIKKALDLPHLLIAGPTEGEVTRAAVCAGSCGDLLKDALAAGAQFYLTGELRHHDALKAANASCTVVCTLHSNSERISLNRFGDRMRGLITEGEVLVSQKDRDPFAIV